MSFFMLLFIRPFALYLTPVFLAPVFSFFHPGRFENNF